jgi:hypothetical protein
MPIILKITATEKLKHTYFYRQHCQNAIPIGEE